MAQGALPSDVALRRLAASVGRLRVAAFVRLAAARWSTRTDVAPTLVRALYRRLAVVAFRDPIDVADLAVDGDDLRGAGVPPGPALGRTLQRLLELVLEAPSSNTREALLALVRGWQAEQVS